MSLNTYVCSLFVDVKLMQLACKMAKKNQSITWLQPSNMRAKVKQLSFKTSEENYPTLKVGLDIETLKLKSSRPQWLLLNYLASTWTSHSSSEINEKLLQDAMTSKLAVLGLLMKGAHFSMTRTAISTTLQHSCMDLSVCLGLQAAMQTIPILSTSLLSSEAAGSHPHKEGNTHFPASPGRAMNKRLANGKESKDKNWLKLDIQLPNGPEFSHDILSLCSMQVGEIHVNLDPKLNDWFLYVTTITPKQADPQPTIPKTRQASGTAEKTKKKAVSSGKRSSKKRSSSNAKTRKDDCSTTVKETAMPRTSAPRPKVDYLDSITGLTVDEVRFGQVQLGNKYL